MLKITESLNDRAGTNHAVIQATGIFKPEIYSNMAPKDLLTSGDDQLRLLLSHFGSLLDVDEDEAVDEFLTAKRRMKTQSRWSDSLYDIAADQRVFPNLRKLAEILLSFDASNAEIERAASVRTIASKQS